MRHLLAVCALSIAAPFACAAPAAAAPPDLQATLAALSDRVARLERTGPALVPGVYRVHGLQTEIDGSPGFARVSNYTWGGTITFNADGTYRSSVTDPGSTLRWNMCCLPGTAEREPKDADVEKDRGRWTLEGNRLTIKNKSGSSEFSGAGGDLFVRASSNTLDGTSVMLMLVREE